MPRWWAITVPTDYQDASERARQAPEMVAALQPRRDIGGVVELSMYVNPAHHKLLITDISYKKLATNRAELAALEKAERQSSTIPGKETFYHPGQTESLLVSTQRITNADGSTVSHKRWTGVTSDGSTRTLAVGCIGPDDVCDPIIATVVVDESEFRTLKSLTPVTKTDIGEMIALGLFGAALIGMLITVLVKRRRKPAA